MIADAMGDYIATSRSKISSRTYETAALKGDDYGSRAIAVRTQRHADEGHATFLLLVVWFAVAYWFEVGNLARVASGVALFLLHGLAEHGPQSRVGDAMERDVQIVDPHDTLDAVLGQLDARECSTAPVVDGGRLTGLLTADAVAEFLKIQAALDHAPA